MTLDPVTGALSKPAFLERLQQRLDSREDGCGQVRIVKVDIARFSHHVSHLGTEKALALLSSIYARLLTFARDGMAARADYDRFFLELADRASAATVLAAFEHPFQVDEMQIPVGADIGYAEACPNVDSSIDLVFRASIGVALSKVDRRSGGLGVFSPTNVARLARERQIEIGMEAALFGDGLRLVYQPKFDAKTLAIVGLEALIRWTHPKLGPVSPAEFIPIAEESTLIERLTLRTIELVGKDLAAWRNQMALTPLVAINLSPLAVRAECIADLVTALEKNTPPDAVELEVTEGAFCDDRLLSAVDRLSANGYRISIDDFGQDRSNLWRLSQLPVSSLKLDKSLIDRIVGDKRARLIVQTVIELADRLGLSTIAEGVETEEQLDALVALNCDVIQGYLLGRPVERGEVAKLANYQLRPSHRMLSQMR